MVALIGYQRVGFTTFDAPGTGYIGNFAILAYGRGIVERDTCNLVVTIFGTIVTIVPPFIGPAIGISIRYETKTYLGPGPATKRPGIERFDLPTIGRLLARGAGLMVGTMTRYEVTTT